MDRSHARACLVQPYYCQQEKALCATLGRTERQSERHAIQGSLISARDTGDVVEVLNNTNVYGF